MCVDNRAINKITIKYKFLILRLEDMFDYIAGSLRHIWVVAITKFAITQEMNESKTQDSLFEWMVILFGLSNVPSTFMRLMKKMSLVLLWDSCSSAIYRKFLIVILMTSWCIVSKSSTEHVDHLRQLFYILRETELFVNLKKCVFFQPRVLFLGSIMCAQRYLYWSSQS